MRSGLDDPAVGLAEPGVPGVLLEEQALGLGVQGRRRFVHDEQQRLAALVRDGASFCHVPPDGSVPSADGPSWVARVRTR